VNNNNNKAASGLPRGICCT